MSRSKPYYVPRCSQCHKKYWLRGNKTDWQNTEFVKLSGKRGAIVRCRACGYEWRSVGRAAREWRREQ